MPLLVHVQHDLHRLGLGAVEDALQHEHDELHRRVVVVVQQHLVERRLLELLLGPGPGDDVGRIRGAALAHAARSVTRAGPSGKPPERRRVARSAVRRPSRVRVDAPRAPRSHRARRAADRARPIGPSTRLRRVPSEISPRIFRPPKRMSGCAAVRSISISSSRAAGRASMGSATAVRRWRAAMDESRPLDFRFQPVSEMEGYVASRPFAPASRPRSDGGARRIDLRLAEALEVGARSVRLATGNRRRAGRRLCVGPEADTALASSLALCRRALQPRAASETPA